MNHYFKIDHNDPNQYIPPDVCWEDNGKPLLDLFVGSSRIIHSKRIATNDEN
jgi:hypothetical protein